VFKRIREGLFRRDEDQSREQQVQVAPEPTSAGTTSEPDASEASTASMAQAAATVDDSVIEQPAAAEGDEVEPVEEYDDALEAESAGSARGILRNPFRLGLTRTRNLFGRVNEALDAEEITDEFWDDLEETLITGDVGVETTDRLLQTLRQHVEIEHLTTGAQVREALKEELLLLLGDPEPLVFSDTSPISVYLVVGVNGVGKTTSIAKIAQLLKRQKHRVMLAAGDTFRAAATEQLKTWGERIGVPVVSHQHGADPAAVVYDAMQSAQARNADVLIVDTAGRLHTKFNLMEELKKIMRVLQKYDPEAPHEVLLVMDATTGQNGFAQAKQFVQDAGVSGIVLTKLDGTARGGIVFAVASELGLPIKFVGTGERVGDIAPFDPEEFVDALFE